MLNFKFNLKRLCTKKNTIESIEHRLTITMGFFFVIITCTAAPIAVFRARMLNKLNYKIHSCRFNENGRFQFVSTDSATNFRQTTNFYFLITFHLKHIIILFRCVSMHIYIYIMYIYICSVKRELERAAAIMPSV